MEGGRSAGSVIILRDLNAFFASFIEFLGRKKQGRSQGGTRGTCPPPSALTAPPGGQGTGVIRDLQAPKAPANHFTPLLCSLKKRDVTLKKYSAALLTRALPAVWIFHDMLGGRG